VGEGMGVWGCGGVGMVGVDVRVVGGVCVSVQVTNFPNQLTCSVHD